MKRIELNIGLFGFGCVGYGLYEVLQQTSGLQASIRKICVRDKTKARPPVAVPITFRKENILEDESINVVVELIDDAEAAFEIVSSALRAGKAVVSANKKMIAEHLPELLELQRTYNVPLLYEGACCASIPIIRNLEEYYDHDLLESVEGIVNGSTNYILTKTASENLSYSQALKQAQDKGYAESNPLLDTGGFDAKYKLVILLAHGFGAFVHPDEIFNIGIDRLGDLELKYAREKNLKIKLVAWSARDQQGKVQAFVLPKFIQQDDKLFGVDDVFNGVKIKSCFADQHFYSGKGAGAHPTASAVLSDISALTYDYRYEYKKSKLQTTLASEEQIELKVLLRFKAGSNFRSQFLRIEEEYSAGTQSFIVGNIALDVLRELAETYEDCSFVLFECLETGTQLFDLKFVEEHLQE
jgi:homoserine dehydrogenase